MFDSDERIGRDDVQRERVDASDELVYIVLTDGGSEFRIAGGGDFGDRLYEKLAATNPPRVRDRTMLSHSYNPPSQPTAAAFVERRSIRMAVQAEQPDPAISNHL